MRNPTREYNRVKEKLERILAKRGENCTDTKKAARLAGRNAAKINGIQK